MSRPKTILVAESDEEQAKQISSAMSAQGWKVILARDAVYATAASLRNRPDAIVLNCRLPGGGGMLTLKRVRASVHTAMTPVIAIIGTREGDAEDLRQNGADECVPSPPDATVIAAWIRQRIEEPAQVMLAPASIIRDPERLESLDRTGILDSAPTEAFDTLTRTTAALLGVPVALVSLVDRHRQFFKSHFGLPEPWASRRETPLTHSFCQWVVSDHDALIVSDAREQNVLRHNRALHELGVVAYAGVPLTPISGEPIGSFCAVDVKPHHWSEQDVALLRELSKVAEALIAIAEFDARKDQGEPKTEAEIIARSLTLRTVGVGISPIAEILRNAPPRLGDAERRDLIGLMELLGQELVRISGAASWAPAVGMQRTTAGAGVHAMH